MPVKTPSFWQHDGVIAKLLTPFSALYYTGHKLKQILSAQPYKASIPVLCVGGAIAGGSGKTPTLHAILDIIGKHKIFQNPVILTRGYGGKTQTATRVDLSKHSFEDVGDEALLHAARATTIVARNRADGARLAEQMGADIILMDDGLQNTSLKKDSVVLVVNSSQGFGNQKLLPSGPLREPIKEALAKADIVVSIGQGKLDIKNVPVLTAHIHSLNKLDLNKTYYGFAGLGDPDKFRKSLIESDANLAGFESFSDHHPYTIGEIQSLRVKAAASSLITTEKDFMRIPSQERYGIDVLPIHIVFENASAIQKILENLR